MAWNPSPEVAAARDFGNKFGADQVVIVFLKHKTGQMGAVTYGRTRQLCDMTKPLGDVAYEAIENHLIDHPELQTY